MPSGWRRIGTGWDTPYTLPSVLYRKPGRLTQKKKPPAQISKTSETYGHSPLSSAVDATMPLIYSAGVAQAQITSGPLPSPEILRKYEEFQPGIAARIVKMAEDEAEHRRKTESSIVALQGRD